MRILVDENIPLLTVSALRDAGNDVLDIRGTHDEGMSDSRIWETACREERLLITTDKGFARYRDVPNHSGILIIRLRHPNCRLIHQRIMDALALFDRQEWPGLLVFMRDNVRSSWRQHK